MQPVPDSPDIRTACCTVSDTAAFLRSLRTIATNHHTHIICFDADRIAGRAHVIAAVTRAARACREGTAISNTIEMESLLYAAGSRQCNIASAFGIHKGGNRVYICCLPAVPGVWEALGSLFCLKSEDWEEIGEDRKKILMRLFGITEEEIAASGGDHRIPELVLERVALLQVTR